MSHSWVLPVGWFNGWETLMHNQQLFLGDVTVITFTAQRREDRSWKLVARTIGEYQPCTEASHDEYPDLTAAELVDLITAIAERSAIV